ncbi:hypothetical protein [Lysobacter sp. CA199]|uniref:hypothetical protein n=1 Tax=Lysobacter sp. CA199 TaxID=3455608 RepID=UPI003F8D6AB6
MASEPYAPTLGEVVSLVRGTTYKSALLGHPGPILLGLGSIQRNGGFRDNSLKTYGGESKPSQLLVKGDLYVSLKDVTQSADLLGAVARVPDSISSGRLTQDTVKLDFGENTYPRRLLYWSLRTSQYRAYCRGHATGTTNLGLAREDFLAYRLPAPTSRALSLVETLEAIDNRIDNLRQTNSTLEAFATALFKSRFVDFDGTLPQKMQESELGLIPMGWSVATLEEHIDAERGLSYKGAGLADPDEGIPMHNLNSILEFGGYKYAGIKYYRGDHRERHLVIPGDIIVANTEQGHEHRLIGFPAIIPKRYASGLYSHHLYRVRLKVGSPITREWLYHCLKTPSMREQIISCANGSTVNMLKAAGLQIPRFALPPNDLCEEFDAFAEPLRLKVESNVEQMETLAILRDTLLPCLVPKQLRIDQ